VTYALYIMFGIMFGGLERLAANWVAVVGLAMVVGLAVWPHRSLHRLLVPALFVLLCARVLPTRLLGG